MGACAIAVVAAIVFVSAARLPFISDDYSYLEAVRQPGWWHAESIWNPVGAPFTGLYRPLLYMWFGMLYHVFGLHPLPFHVATGLLVALAAVMTGLVAHRLGLRSGAVIAAAVYGLHATMVWPIGWTSAASSPLATALALGAVYLLLGSRIRVRTVVAASALFFLALMTREVVAVTPAALLIGAYVMDPGSSWTQRLRRSLLVSSPLWLVLAAYAITRHAAGFDSPAGAYEQRIGIHALTNLWRLMQYATEFGQSTHLGSLVAVSWLTLAGLCVYAAVRFDLRVGLIGLAWALLGMLPVIFLVNHQMDHYYVDFALPGIALAVGTVFQAIAESVSKDVRAVAAALVVVGLAILGFSMGRQEQRPYLDRSARLCRSRRLPEATPSSSLPGSTIQLPITATQAAYGSYPDLVRVVFDDSSLQVRYEPPSPGGSG